MGRKKVYEDEGAYKIHRRELKKAYSQTESARLARIRRTTHLREDQCVIRVLLGNSVYAADCWKYNPHPIPSDLKDVHFDLYGVREIRQVDGWLEAWSSHHSPFFTKWCKSYIEIPDFTNQIQANLEAILVPIPYKTFVGRIDAYCLRQLILRMNGYYSNLDEPETADRSALVCRQMIARIFTLQEEIEPLDRLWDSTEGDRGTRTRNLAWLLRYWKYHEISLLRLDLWMRFNYAITVPRIAYRLQCLAWQRCWAAKECLADDIYAIWWLAVLDSDDECDVFPRGNVGEDIQKDNGEEIQIGNDDAEVGNQLASDKSILAGTYARWLRIQRNEAGPSML